MLLSIEQSGILVPLVVGPKPSRRFEIISGHRRYACARKLGISSVPVLLRRFDDEEEVRAAVLDYNRQRRKTFSQLMREADCLRALLEAPARARRLANLRRGTSAAVASQPDSDFAECRNSDGRAVRSDTRIAQLVGLGGKDLYRQARAVWTSGAVWAMHEPGAPSTHSTRAPRASTRPTRTFAAGIDSTPTFGPPLTTFGRSGIDRAFGLPHAGSIPASIVAHLLHYYTEPGDLVVDPMAGGGTTLDVASAMQRRCLAYDIEPVRAEVTKHDVTAGFPPEARGCRLIFCDPPYHTMLDRRLGRSPRAGAGSLQQWLEFLRPGEVGHLKPWRPAAFWLFWLPTRRKPTCPRASVISTMRFTLIAA